MLPGWLFHSYVFGKSLLDIALYSTARVYLNIFLRIIRVWYAYHTRMIRVSYAYMAYTRIIQYAQRIFRIFI